MSGNRVIIIEPSEIIRLGMTALLQNHAPGYEVLTMENTDPQIEQHFLDECSVMIVNPAAPENSDERLKQLRQDAINHNFKLFALVYAYFDEHLLSLFDEVIYINDNEPEILDKLKRQQTQTNETYLLDENTSLSQRELDVIRLVALGYSNREIAEDLFISIHTVISHRKNITAKLGIKSAPGLTIYAVINKLISPDDFKKTSGLRRPVQL